MGAKLRLGLGLGFGVVLLKRVVHATPPDAIMLEL